MRTAIFLGFAYLGDKINPEMAFSDTVHGLLAVFLGAFIAMDLSEWYERTVK